MFTVSQQLMLSFFLVIPVTNGLGNVVVVHYYTSSYIKVFANISEKEHIQLLQPENFRRKVLYRLTRSVWRRPTFFLEILDKFVVGNIFISTRIYWSLAKTVAALPGLISDFNRKNKTDRWRLNQNKIDIFFAHRTAVSVPW